MKFMSFLVFCLLIVIANSQKSLWEVPDRSKIDDSSSEDDIIDISFPMTDMRLPQHKTLKYNSARANSEEILPWPKGIVPFKLDESYFNFERKLIREAMNEIEYYSCVTFRNREPEDTSYLNIRNLHYCASGFGFKGNRQTLSLSSKTCMKRGIIVHELMHALGFIHEHSRHDRDDYVKIFDDNIDPEFLYNFDIEEKHRVKDFGEGYDYNSIMHYDKFAYAIDKSKPVMEALKPEANLDIRENLSQKDIIKLNKFYNCSINGHQQ